MIFDATAVAEEIDTAQFEQLVTLRQTLQVLVARADARLEMSRAATQPADRCLEWPEVAQRLNTNVERARELARSGALRSVKLGRRGRRVTVAAVQEFLESGGVSGVRKAPTRPVGR